jgi:hypothetical protein
MNRLVAFAVLACIATPAVAQQPTIETKTIELKQLKPAEAVRLLRPYIVNAGGGVFDVSDMLPIITIKDVGTNIATLERVLAKYDQSPATIRLVFQLIEADTGPRAMNTATTRPVPVDLDSTLRSVLKFPSYRLLAQGIATVGEFSDVTQQFANAADGSNPDGMYRLAAQIGTVRISTAAPGDTSTLGSVNMRVSLSRLIMVRTAQSVVQQGNETVISTGLDVPIGTTVVLGTAMTRKSGVALILTVRPELVRAK